MSHGTLNLVPDVATVSRTAAPAAERGSRPRGRCAHAVETLAVEAGLGCAVLATLLLVGLAPAALAGTVALWVLTRALRAEGASARWSVGPRRVLESAVLVAAVTAAAVAWADLGVGPLRQMLVTTALLACAALVGRWLARRRRGPVRVLLVGDATAARLAERAWPSEVVSVAAVAQLGDPDEVVDLLDGVADGPVDVVVVTAGGGLTGSGLRRLGWALEERGVSLVLLDDLEPTSRHRLRLVGIGGRHLLEVCSSRPRLLVRLAKCLLDRAAGLALLILVSPALVVLAVAVRLDSPGPAIFRQTRIGRYGRPFTMLKLRTMHVGSEQGRARLLDANEADAVLFKIRRDPRITRIGTLLRRSSLDELPQLLNVVRGEMSLVGPRPALPQEVAQYDELARRRLVVLPGITGLWQVSGRSDLDWDESVALDVHYADNLTLAGDLAICLRTVRAVLLAKGAY